MLIHNNMKTSLKIAIIGATGNAGKRITAEALNRGHHVTGIARTVDSVTPRNNLTILAGDINDPEGLARVIKGHDLAISSVKFTDFNPDQLIKAIRLSGVKRYLVVGGASMLEVAPGVT